MYCYYSPFRLAVGESMAMSSSNSRLRAGTSGSSSNPKSKPPPVIVIHGYNSEAVCGVLFSVALNSNFNYLPFSSSPPVISTLSSSTTGRSIDCSSITLASQLANTKQRKKQRTRGRESERYSDCLS